MNNNLYFKKTKVNINNFLIIFFIFLIWRPNLNINIVGRFGVRSIDFLMLFITFLIFLFLSDKLKVDKNIIMNFYFFSFMYLGVIISFAYAVFCLNYPPQIRDFFEFYRLPFYLMIIILGFYTGIIGMIPKIMKIFLYSGIFQSLLGILQLFNIFYINNWLNYIYSTEKVKPISGISRVTGSFGNPNTYGFFIVIWLIFLIIYKHEFKKIFFISYFTLGLLALVFSASRTSILTFLIFTISYLFIKTFKKITLFKLINFILLCSIALFVTYYFYIYYLVDFKYLSNTVKLILAGDFMKINSISIRLNHWRNIYKYILISPILGWGPGKYYFNVGDNDYIFTMFRYGIVGSALKYGYFIWISVYSFKTFINKKRRFDLFVFAIIFSMFIFALMGDIFMSLKVVPIVFFIIGLNFGDIYYDKKKKVSYARDN